MFEHQGVGKLDRELTLGRSDRFERSERGATEIEEVVVDADPIDVRAPRPR